MAPPFGELKYLYVGVKAFETNLAYYRDVLGGDVLWNVHAFDANVAAIKLGTGTPYVLLADHRPAPSSMPVYIVESLAKTVRALERRGWKKEAGPFGIPDGTCYTFLDPSGNAYAFFENERPDALVAEHGAEQRARTR